MTDKKKVRLMLYDTYSEFSGNRVPITISPEEEDELIKEASKELRESYGFLYDDKKNGGSVITGTRARSLTSLTDGTILNDKNEHAAYKKMLYWSRDAETANLPTIDQFVMTSSLFMWGVTNSGWIYNRPEVLFGGEVRTELERKLQMGIPRVDKDKPDTQHIQYLKYVIEMFTEEGDVVWDVKNNIPDLAELCEDLKREYVSGQLDKSEWDYNEDIEYGIEPMDLDLSDLEVSEIKETTAQINTIEQGDCFEWMNDIADESWDLLLTDPPYNVSDADAKPFATQKTGFNFGDWDFGFDTRRWINQVAPKVKQGGMVVIYNSFKNMEIMARVLEQWGYTIIGMPYWVKSNPIPHLINRVPLNGIESHLLAVRGNIEDVKVNTSESDNLIYRPSTRDYVVIDRHEHSQHAQQQERFHTTQKPEDLFLEHMVMWSEVNDIVGDTFSGSGTTPVKSRDTGRNFYAVEQDDYYFKRSTERLNNGRSKRVRLR